MNPQSVQTQTVIDMLVSVLPSLSPIDIVEQANCFLFNGDSVTTFDGSTLSTVPVCRGDDDKHLRIKGAIPRKFLDVLQKLKDESITISQSENVLVIGGARKKTKIVIQEDILSPIESVEPPDVYTEVGEGFCNYVSMCCRCAGKDARNFVLTCVHLTPDTIECTDGYRVMQCKVSTGLNHNYLVRAAAMKSVALADVVAVSETGEWLHFLTTTGLRISCQHSRDDYELDVSKHIQDGLAGDVVNLPKGIVESSERASVFSSDDTDNDVVTVELKGTSLRIKGESAAGSHVELKRVKWRGPPLKFAVDPVLLKEVVSHSTECRVGEGTLCIGSFDDDSDTGFVYVTAIQAM